MTRAARPCSQRGFSSTEEGNSIAERVQWDKLRLVREVAVSVWDDADEA